MDFRQAAVQGSPEALYQKRERGLIRCLLCPAACLLSEGSTGRCGVRSVSDGTLRAAGYGLLTAQAADPVEKKPLYHFLPGTRVWSVGFNGCNLHCPFCQNNSIADPGYIQGHYSSPDNLVRTAVDQGCAIIAYTYSEPTVHIEYLLETAREASLQGLKNVLVTNGNILAEPAAELLDQMDAVNVDLKSWDSGYYSSVLGGSLRTVKDFIGLSAAKCWTEVTTLVVPSDNDDPGDIGKMAAWLATFSESLPLHLSAYHPAKNYRRPPTAPNLLLDLKNIAEQHLRFVYTGNIGIDNTTNCPNCRAAVIKRSGYQTESRLKGGSCPECSYALPGVFPADNGSQT